jgi:hypothetical protein
MQRVVGEGPVGARRSSLPRSPHAITSGQARDDIKTSRDRNGDASCRPDRRVVVVPMDA